MKGKNMGVSVHSSNKVLKDRRDGAESQSEIVAHKCTDEVLGSLQGFYSLSFAAMQDAERAAYDIGVGVKKSLFKTYTKDDIAVFLALGIQGMDAPKVSSALINSGFCDIVDAYKVVEKLSLNAWDLSQVALGRMAECGGKEAIMSLTMDQAELVDPEHMPSVENLKMMVDKAGRKVLK